MSLFRCKQSYSVINGEFLAKHKKLIEYVIVKIRQLVPEGKIPIIIAIDTTGSMSGSIKELKEKIAFFQILFGLYTDYKLIFIDFNDMGLNCDTFYTGYESLIVVTDDVNEIRSANHGFGNGGECCKLAICIAQIVNPRYVFVITDDNYHKGNKLAQMEDDIITACELPTFTAFTNVIGLCIGSITNLSELFPCHSTHANGIVKHIADVITTCEFEMTTDNALDNIRILNILVDKYRADILSESFALTILAKIGPFRLKFTEVQQFISKIGTLCTNYPEVRKVLDLMVRDPRMVKLLDGELMLRLVHDGSELPVPYLNEALASMSPSQLETIINKILKMTIVESTHGIPVDGFKIEHCLSTIINSYFLKGRFRFIIALKIVVTLADEEYIVAEENKPAVDIIFQAAVAYLVATAGNERIVQSDPANLSYHFLALLLSEAARGYLTEEELEFAMTEMKKILLKNLSRIPFVARMLSFRPVKINQFEQTACIHCERSYPSTYCLRVIDGVWTQSNVCTFCELTNSKDKNEACSVTVRNQNPQANHCSSCGVIYVTLQKVTSVKSQCFACATGCVPPPKYACNCGYSSYSKECVLCLNDVTCEVITSRNITLADDDIAQLSMDYARFLEEVENATTIRQIDRSCAVCGIQGFKACSNYKCNKYICITCHHWEDFQPGRRIAKSSLHCCACSAPYSKHIMNANPKILALIAEAGVNTLQNCMTEPSTGVICKKCFCVCDIPKGPCGIESEDRGDFVCERCTVSLPGDVFYCPNPVCGVPIQSKGGCPHFECTQCHSHFCQYCTDAGVMDAKTIYTKHIFPLHRCGLCYGYVKNLDDHKCDEQ